MNNKAKWIAALSDWEAGAITFRRDFHTEKEIASATADITSIGVYAFFFNGKRVGKGVLMPGWTVYQKRVQYQTYDITDRIGKENRIEIGVGPGWALGTLAWGSTKDRVGSRLAMRASIRITYTDGSEEEILSDTDWDLYTSEVVASEWYHGETIDKTAPIEYLGKAVLSTFMPNTIPQIGEWIVENERLAPVAVFRTPKNELVVDFGQNMAGYVEIRVRGPRGSRIVLHHAEVLDRDGNFYNDNFRAARNENVYILSGEEDVFKPLYCYQGFRYIRLTEYPFDTVDPNAFRAIAVHSELKRTGHFCCGNAKINQLYHNVIWGQKSNYLDIPTDCPQRDERFGWTGDAQVFCRAAAINFDVEKFITKWLEDIAFDQGEDGSIPHAVPKAFDWGGASGYADAACIVPWQMYLAYGNREALATQFPMMKKWVEYMRNFGEDESRYLNDSQFGDWLAMDFDPDQTYGATPTDFIACAFYAYSTSLVVKTGKVLGEDVSEYEQLYTKIREAFRACYIVDGKLRLLPNVTKKESDPPLPKETQTAYVLSLFFDLTDGEETAHFAARLAEMIHENGDRMTTGFLGTPYLLHVLSQNGYTDLAYTLLLQEKTPSWLYSVDHGATTMWEHWNSIKEDGTFWSTSMNSFNHYAYGAVYDWIFGVAVGIQPIPQAPAYREVRLEPHPHPALGFADASIDSRSGRIRAHWYYKENTVYYEFEIPQGAIAHLRLPSGYTETLTGGNYHFAE